MPDVLRRLELSRIGSLCRPSDLLPAASEIGRGRQSASARLTLRGNLTMRRSELLGSMGHIRAPRQLLWLDNEATWLRAACSVRDKAELTCLPPPTLPLFGALREPAPDAWGVAA
jgi:hypothetical protein